MDGWFRMADLSDGIEMDTPWFRNSDPVDASTKQKQAEVVSSISQTVNFDTQNSRFHRSESFQDQCAKTFPRINMVKVGRVDRQHIGEVGVLVCGIGWDADT